METRQFDKHQSLVQDSIIMEKIKHTCDVDFASMLNYNSDMDGVIIAHDASGGVFEVYNNEDTIRGSGILYISSEGHAGLVSSSFDQFLSLIVYYPYWQDIIKFSGNADSRQLNKLCTLMENNFLKDYPEIVELRRKMRCDFDVTNDPALISYLLELAKLDLDITRYNNRMLPLPMGIYTVDDYIKYNN